MFPANVQKKPFADSMNRFAELKTLAEIRKRGQSLPGHVVKVISSMIVTVAFDVEDAALETVTMPVAGAQYLRVPIQEGDQGVALSASVPIANISGLGTGNPDLTTLNANLSMLTWFPVGNINWGQVDLNTLVLYGPVGGNGVQLQDLLADPGVTVTIKNGVFTVTAGAHMLQISAAGIVLDGITWGTHAHSKGTYEAPDGPLVSGESGSPQNP